MTIDPPPTTRPAALEATLEAPALTALPAAFFWRAQERADFFLNDDKYAVNLEAPYSEDYQEDIAHISYLTFAGDEYHSATARPSSPRTTRPAQRRRCSPATAR